MSTQAVPNLGTNEAGTQTQDKDNENGRSALKDERGSTQIADIVVTKVAGIAAREVPGVYDLGGGTARAWGSVTHKVGIGDGYGQGVSVEVGEREAAVDLTVVIEYGESIPDVVRRIRDNVTKRLEGITGLKVAEVNIAVNDLHLPGDDQPSGSEAQGGSIRS